MQIAAIAAAGLQRQRAQAECVGGAQALLRVGQRIQDARVGPGLAAAGGGHVDDEGAMFVGRVTQRIGGIRRLVLPGESAGAAALAQATMTREPRQVLFECRQGVRDQTRVAGNAQQMFVQWLFARAIVVGIRIQGIALVT